jgi:hypothetical protein
MARAAATGDSRGAYKVSVYPIHNLDRSFMVRLGGTVAKGAALYPVLNGLVVAATVTAKSKGVAAAPTATAGHTYIVPAGGWSGNANAIAVGNGSTFDYTTCDTTTNLGLTVYVEDIGRAYTWNGTAWVLAKVACFAGEAGVAGDEIEGYLAKVNNRVDRDGLPADVNASIIAIGTATVASGSTSITVTNADWVASDTVMCTVKKAGATACYVKSAVITVGSNVGTLTITTSADPSTGGADIFYSIIRAIS